jgi:hypothetical protein
MEQRFMGDAGDEDDLAMLFPMTTTPACAGSALSKGLRRGIDDIFCCTCVRSCAISPDGKYLALGADERIGTVVLYRL